jgi:hypothetical protein
MRNFDEDCLTNPPMCLKLEFTIVARRVAILVYVIVLYTLTFSLGGGKMLLQPPSTDGSKSDLT